MPQQPDSRGSSADTSHDPTPTQLDGHISAQSPAQSPDHPPAQPSRHSEESSPQPPEQISPFASDLATQAMRDLAELHALLLAAATPDGFAPSQKDFCRKGHGNACAYRRFFPTFGDFVRSAGLKTARERVHQYSADRRAAARAAAQGLNEFPRTAPTPAPASTPANPSTLELHDPAPKKEPSIAEPPKIAAAPLPITPRATPQPRSTEPVYGDRLHGCGMAHAPVNEQGVVLLFGMLAKELNFEIEMVRTAYPDCEAKRQGKDGKWRKVLIEFEFATSRFDHDPEGCDLIVCWEDDRNTTGLEVLELKKYMAQLVDSQRLKASKRAPKPQAS
ncbi:MAG: hypothetical protein JNK16_03735 [Phycisphaerales bacterium]|nr:hypothetical protein [Phycisphaerales bacterium]